MSEREKVPDEPAGKKHNVNSSSKLAALREFLGSTTPGAIDNPAELESLLAACWHELEGRDSESMAGYKLSGRMEKVTWQPPVLAFTIERHGGVVRGSSRAELQEWSVDTTLQTASCTNTGHRQLYPMQPRFKVEPVVEDLMESIRSRKDDARLKWHADGSVQIMMNKIIPEHSAAKETVAGRRKRLANALAPRLADEGWHFKAPPYRYQQKASRGKRQAVLTTTPIQGQGRSFGGHLRALREQAGLSRAEVARRAGVATTTLRNWEADRGMPSMPVLLQLAGMLGVPVEQIAEGVEDPAEEES
jgi:putative transcriptional regulator